MRFYLFFLFVVFLQYNNIAFGQRGSINIYLNKSIYKNIAGNWLSKDFELLNWSINYDDYYYQDFFNKSIEYGLIDSISIATCIKKERILKRYNKWKEGEDLTSLKSIVPSFDRRVNDSILRANAIKDDDQLVNQWGEDSLIVLNRTIEFFGLLYLPNNHILTVVRTRCLGLCSEKYLVVYKYVDDKSLKIIYRRLVEID